MKTGRKYRVVLVLAVSLCVLLWPAKGRSQSIPQLVEQLLLDKEKLAQLKTILQDMYKSYQIIDQGYSEIQHIVQGNFNLHKAFLDGLLAVSPVVRNYARVADIINAEYRIVSEYKAAYGRYVSGGHFTPQELDYIAKLYNTLFNRSLDCVNELAMVITDNALRMSDAERLRAIDGIYDDITGQLSQLRTFSNSTSVQEMQRAKEAGDIGTLKSIYGITK